MTTRSLLLVLACAAGFALIACNGFSLPDTTSNGDETGDDSAAGVTLRGVLTPGETGKIRPRAQDETYPFTVVAQSDATGEVFRAQTDDGGAFEFDIPASENGNTFMVTILGPDGRAVGPVVFQPGDGTGVTGLAMDRDADLGTITLPDDPTNDPIEPGTDADITGLPDANVTAVLNTSGVPVGVSSFGKGSNIGIAVGDGPGRQTDADQDGLIDIFDADDDGDGVVDDFDGDGSAGGEPAQIRANFFMNLKIQPEQAPTYYSGTATDIAARLAVDTVITLEVIPEPSAGVTITGAHLLETPGPAYLPTADKVTDSAGGLTYQTWADTSYAFDAQTDRHDAFCRPNAVMNAGDSFTVEVALSDGTTAQYTRMINYIFKNIPKLVQYGSASALATFDVTSTTINGTWDAPIPFDGTQDLILNYAPPPDELGVAITGMAYTFQVFYETATDQLNDDIDWGTTFPTPITGFDRGTYYVAAADLGALAGDGTYTVTLPHEIFPDTVTLTDASTVAVARYKIDITAECSSGNAAIMLTFVKQ